MSTIIRRVGRFIRSEDGPTAVEYAVMVALIAVAIITAVSQPGHPAELDLRQRQDDARRRRSRAT